ncbi:tRNA 2'-phosphotransferase 1 [Anoplophora glabripennis]|uniref:tRNA 2'-phosphotransferase 1 n=1 Tax=Anoplophora glabripennis TaxID=217634 RepID=UPI0008739822|nr:tRNA 2'-phosphotransferase 1 [Anoplophora glabripennis]
MSFEKDIQLSKTLSWLLRHGAVKEGLHISREGFVSVVDILNHKSLRNRYNLEDIKRVVDVNDKQRFRLRCNDGIWEICANQGHSLKAVEDPDLVPILEANGTEAIHGTYNKNWHAIKKQGLKCMGRNHIHFATGLPDDRAVVSGMRKTAEVFIYINLPLALSDGIKFFKSTNGVILSSGNDKGIIDPKYFLKVCDSNGKFLL